MAYHTHPCGYCEGGELELFEARMHGDRMVEATPAAAVTPQANRLVLFEVGPHTLHQGREVTAGGRGAQRVVLR